MKVIGMRLRAINMKRFLEITLITEEGEYVFMFGKKTARQLMRAIFLQIGIDPRYGPGRETLPDYLDQNRPEE